VSKQIFTARARPDDGPLRTQHRRAHQQHPAQVADAAGERLRIESVRGVGYQLVVEWKAELAPHVARRFTTGGRLFWKFFLAFWVALLIAAGAVVGAVFVYQQNQERRVSQVEQGPRADFRVGPRRAWMNHGGIDALKAFLREEIHRRARRFSQVDAQGHDLLGRIVAAERAHQCACARA